MRAVHWHVDGRSFADEEVLKLLFEYMCKRRKSSGPRMDCQSLIPHGIALQQQDLGVDIRKGGELAEFRGAGGQRKFLEIFFKVSNAVWQQLRNILPRHMFPPIKKMREFDAELNRAYGMNISISRTFSGFQMNIEGFMEASLL